MTLALAFWEAYVFIAVIRCLHTGHRCQVYMFSMQTVYVFYCFKSLQYKCVFESIWCLTRPAYCCNRSFSRPHLTVRNDTTVIYTCAHCVSDISVFESLRFRCFLYDVTQLSNTCILESVFKCMRLRGKRRLWLIV